MDLARELLEDLLARWPVARLATVSATGQPHCVPVVFCAFQGAIYVPLDSKRKRDTQLKRFANVAEVPRAALLLDHYAADWQQLWWVRVDGAARRVDSPAAAPIVDILHTKYPQYRDGGFDFDRRTFLQVGIERLSAWSQSGTAAAISTTLDRLRSASG